MSLDKLNQAINEKIKSFAKVQTVWAEAKEVNWEEKTMAAIGVSDELPYYDVLLGLENIQIKPKQGTICLIGLIENDETKPFLIWADEVESYEVKVGETEFKMQDGFLLKKQNETLYKLMADLLQAIQNMNFTHPQGPTTGLVNLAEFTAIAQRFQTFLKDD